MAISNLPLAVLIFTLNVVGQAAQNLCLPLALTDNPNMAVFFCYTALFYFFFFQVLEALLDLFRDVKFERPNSWLLLSVAMQNALNGVGVIFAGSPDRVPLTIQMAVSLLMNCGAPLFKVFAMDVPLSKMKPGLVWYAVTVVIFGVALTLMTVDKLDNMDAGSSTAWMILFAAGMFFGMSYNVYQEKMVEKYQLQKLTKMDSFHLSIKVLRMQTFWLFVFSWLSFPFSAIDGVTDPILTADTFRSSWAEFLTFNSNYMTAFNIAYLITFFSSIFMNTYDSSFNMLTSNLSNVSILWAGWTTMFQDAIGYRPSVAYTVPAIVLGFVGCFTSFKLSESVDNLKKTVDGESEEKRHLLNGERYA